MASEKFIDIENQNKYSVEMIIKSIKGIVPIDDFLKMLIFDYLIGNSDRHQSNWAMIYFLCLQVVYQTIREKILIQF